MALVGGVNSDLENGQIKKDAAPAQLYDLEADRNQTKNLYNEYPDVVKRMHERLSEFAPKKDGEL